MTHRSTQTLVSLCLLISCDIVVCMTLNNIRVVRCTPYSHNLGFCSESEKGKQIRVNWNQVISMESKRFILLIQKGLNVNGYFYSSTGCPRNEKKFSLHPPNIWLTNRSDWIELSFKEIFLSCFRFVSTFIVTIYIYVCISLQLPWVRIM